MRGASKVPSIRVNAGRKFGWMRGASVDAWRIRWSQSHPVDAGRNGVRDNQVSWMRDASTDAWRIGFRLESERDWNVAVILGIGCVAHPWMRGASRTARIYSERFLNPYLMGLVSVSSRLTLTLITAVQSLPPLVFPLMC